MVRFTDYRKRKYGIEFNRNELQFELGRINKEGVIKRKYKIKKTEQGWQCQGRKCGEGFVCEHVRMVDIMIQEQGDPMLQEKIINLEQKMQRLKSVLDEKLAFTKQCITSTKEIIEEETRQRYLVEMMAFFPDRLTHLQCKVCLRDRFCWRGQPQGFLCAGFFMTLSKEPFVIEKMQRLQFTFLDQPAMAAEDRQELLNRLDFRDLVGLSYLVGANLYNIAVINKNNMRNLLSAILIDKDESPYRLTDVSHFGIMDRTGGYKNAQDIREAEESREGFGAGTSQAS